MSKLLEYSVIYTSRAVNLMSKQYQQCVKDINKNLCQVYNAKKCALIPGSGTTGMESVARQFGTNKNCMVIRNGYFSYRWSQIFETGNITDNLNIIKANVNEANMIQPPSLSKVCDMILKNKPDLVCAPHVETSTGVIISDNYINEVAKATRKVGGLFCLDGIASGTLWTDMNDLLVDIYLTAPQKGWSSPASCGVVMLGDRALEKLDSTNNSSFTLDLKKWCQVTDAYNDDKFMYHCTVPTNSLIEFRDNIQETINFGLDKAKNNAIKLGKDLRKILEENGYKSVAENGYKSPTVIVSYAEENMVEKFKNNGIQVAGYVPFKLDEPENLNTFRIGLFGIDKLSNPNKTIEIFKENMLK